MKKENPKIKIIREFKEYVYYNPLNVFKGLKKTGTNINIFGNQVAICISEEDISFYIWFGIVGDIFNTKKNRCWNHSFQSFYNIKNKRRDYIYDLFSKLSKQIFYAVVILQKK